jgi:hypothetical protein
MAIDEIERWFDTDPEAPVILYSMPPVGSSFEDVPRVQISINQHGVEREIRARGIDERHPAWDLALSVVGPTLRDTTKELLKESISMLMEDDLLEDPPWVDVPSHQSGWSSSGEQGWVSSDEP